jgi:hypothetical protein
MATWLWPAFAGAVMTLDRERSDLRVYLADPANDVGRAPLDDTCTYNTAFGTRDAQAGCGIPVAIDGSVVNTSHDEVIFIANGRNAIHIMTQTFQEADVGATEGEYNESIAVQVSSYSSDGVVLCNEATVLREGYKDGLTYVPVTSLGDPTSTISDATISHRDQGNTLYIIPYALRAVHGPPYPELTIVLVPSKVQENIHRNCTVDADSGVTTCFCAEERGWMMLEDKSCRWFEYEKLQAIQFTVKVRTEPELQTLRDELVPNCEYAYEQDHTFTIGQLEFDQSASSGAPRSAAAALVPGVALAAAVLLVYFS